MTISSLTTCAECGGAFNTNRIIFGYCTECFIVKDKYDLSEGEIYYRYGYSEGYKIGHGVGYNEGSKDAYELRQEK